MHTYTDQAKQAVQHALGTRACRPDRLIVGCSTCFREQSLMVSVWLDDDGDSLEEYTHSSCTAQKATKTSKSSEAGS